MSISVTNIFCWLFLLFIIDFRIFLYTDVHSLMMLWRTFEETTDRSVLCLHLADINVKLSSHYLHINLAMKIFTQTASDGTDQTAKTHILVSVIACCLQHHHLLCTIFTYSAGLGGSVGFASDWWSGGRGFDPRRVGNMFSWRFIMKYFLRSFSPFSWFKKGSCQFLAK